MRIVVLMAGEWSGPVRAQVNLDRVELSMWGSCQQITYLFC